MQIIIQTSGFKASEALEAFINEKVGKLAGYSQNIIRADVTLSKGAETELQNNYCEIRLEVPGNDLFAKNQSSGFEQSIAATVYDLKHMVEKNKGKAVTQRHDNNTYEEEN
jgi:putative sigma-54 modulation protein